VDFHAVRQTRRAHIGSIADYYSGNAADNGSKDASIIPEETATSAYLPRLITLANANWHMQHENIFEALDDLRLPEAVDTLYRATLASYTYGDYDQANSLAVKAIWALGNIGDHAAIERLASLSNQGSEIIRQHAAGQLERIANEASDLELRAAARGHLEKR
jgi:HEAT repeat protein